MKERGFREGYDALEEELNVASMLIAARIRASLTQAELAEKMGTSQSTIARLEGGAATPSLSTCDGWRRRPTCGSRSLWSPRRAR